MKYKDFRDYKITRNCDKNYTNYKSFKPYLKIDFQNRCAYCNLKDESVTTYFEVDHFVPKDSYKNVFPELETDYKNLIYSCKKCNLAKKDQFEGDIIKDKYVNAKFYDPVNIDYNEIFYRDEFGGIQSDDEKGKNMIINLQLYRPIHNLAWICEELEVFCENTKKKIENSNSEDTKGAWEKVHYNILKKKDEFSYLFISGYNDKNLVIDDIDKINLQKFDALIT